MLGQPLDHRGMLSTNLRTLHIPNKSGYNLKTIDLRLQKRTFDLDVPRSRFQPKEEDDLVYYDDLPLDHSFSGPWHLCQVVA